MFTSAAIALQNLALNAIMRYKTDTVHHSANLIIFGLPEGKLTDTMPLLNEISPFLVGSAITMKKILRLGKKLTTDVGCCRPTIYNFVLSWIRHYIVLSAKLKLKSFMYIRQYVH